MKKIKLLLLTLCVVASATMYSSCSDEVSSSDADGSEILSGEGVSADGETSDVASKDESAEVSEETSSVSEVASEEVSAEVSTEESLDVSIELSEDVSAEASEEASTEVSEEASSESASSEETESSGEEQGGRMDMFVSVLESIPEEYMGLDGAKAVDSFIEKYGVKSLISVTGEISMGTSQMGVEYILALDCTGEKAKSSVRGVMSMSGNVMSDNQSIFIGDDCIEIDHIRKTYYYSSMEDADSLIDLRFLDGNITVETKNELVGTEVYVADWFKSADGDIGIFTKDGALKYFCVRMGSGQSVTELLLKIEATETVDSSIFEIPANYTESNNA